MNFLLERALIPISDKNLQDWRRRVNKCICHRKNPRLKFKILHNPNEKDTTQFKIVLQRKLSIMDNRRSPISINSINNRMRRSR